MCCKTTYLASFPDSSLTFYFSAGRGESLGTRGEPGNKATIYQPCKFIPNCTAIDQSNAGFTFCMAQLCNWSIVVPQAPG